LSAVNSAFWVRALAISTPRIVSSIVPVAVI